MAKLPGFDSSAQMTTQPAVVRKDMQAEMQTGRNIATIGQAASEVAAVWQEAKNFSQKITQQNNLEKGINDVVSRASIDQDYNNSQIYHDDLDKIRESSLEGFSDNNARLEFSTIANNQIAQAGIKVDGLFRGKMIDHTRGELITQHEINKTAYIKTGDLSYQHKQKELVDYARQNGFVDEMFTANEIIKVDGWEKLRYLQVAETDPVGAIELVKNSDMEPTEKSAALNNIKSISEQRDITQEIEASIKIVDTVKGLHVAINNPQLSYVDKLNSIQQAESFGLPSSDVKKLENYLNSADKINAKSYDNNFSESMTMIGMLEEGIKEKTKYNDAKKYLQKVREARNYIIDQRTAGHLTEQDEIDLINKLDATVNVETRYGLKTVAKKDEWFQYDYSEAKKDFLKMFNNNEIKSDTAMRQFFYATEGKKLNSVQKRQEATKIIDSVNVQFRENTAKTLAERKTPKMLTDEDIIRQAGFTEEDVQFTIQKSGKTRKEVIDHLRGL